MAAFRRDYDNLRAALEATWKARRLLDFAEFCRLLWVPSVLAGRAREAVEDLQHAVDAESSRTARSGSRGSSYPSSVRVDLRSALAVCQLEIGKVESAYALCIQAIDLAERQPDNSLKLAAYADAVLSAHLLRSAPPEVPDLLNRADELAAQERDLAILASYQCAKGLQCYGSNELESAERMLLLFLQEAYALNDSFATLVALANLGELANAEGRYPVAAAWSERAVHVSATLGSEWVGSAQANLATAWLGVGDVTRAEAMFAAQIQRFWINGDLRAVAELLQRLAACAAARGDQERALTLYGAYRIALDTHGWAVLPAEHRLTNQFLSSSLVGPHADVAITIGYAMSLADAVAFATAS